MALMFSNLTPVTYVWQPLLRQLDEMLDAVHAQADRKIPMTHSLRFDVHESEDLYVLNFDIPGVQREDLTIEMVGHRLHIRGERKSEIYGSQRTSSFSQYIDMPEGVQVEHIAADLKDGVLRLAVQKPVSAKPTKIKVGDGTTKGFLKNLLGTDKKIEVKKASNETAEIMAG